VLITSAESADTLGVSSGMGREGGNAVFAFDQGVYPLVDRPSEAVCPRSKLVNMHIILIEKAGRLVWSPA